MSKSIRKAVVVAMVMGGAAATPMAASAVPNLCQAEIANISFVLSNYGSVCAMGADQSCGRLGVAPTGPKAFLWEKDRLALIAKVDSALDKIATEKYVGAAKNLDEIWSKVDTLDTGDAKTKLRGDAADAILAATEAAQGCL